MNSKIKKTVFQFLICVALISQGCKSAEKLDPKLNELGRAHKASVTEAKPKPHKDVGVMPSNTGKIHKGKIAETIHVANYTYVLVKTSSNEIWTAIPKNESLKNGADIEIIESIVMKNFESKTLSRTFPSIVFGVLKGTGEIKETSTDSGKESKTPKLPEGHPPINK